MKKVFVSYSRRNKAFAERLARDLSDAGLDVWIDFRQIHGGELWQDEIRRGIENSDFLIAALSEDSIQSHWVQFEINTARQKDKFIIPIMISDAVTALRQTDALSWLQDVHFINFDNRYEEAFPELLRALPGTRGVGPFDFVDPENIPNPFKGLEAFQQTDARFFFGRESLIRKALRNLRADRHTRFLAVVGASGSGKSSLVRAGVIPELRSGAIPGSDRWRIVLLTPGAEPIRALATRLSPLLGTEYDVDAVDNALRRSQDSLHELTEGILDNTDPLSRLMIVIDQFEEVFTRAGEVEAGVFLQLLHRAVTINNGRTLVVITMRADFFDRLGRYPQMAELFEQENMVIVTEMTSANLLRAIEGPAQAVGLMYEDGLAERILEDVQRQPGSLPLLQYALKVLYEKRSGRQLTNAAYDEIGGVTRALARHAENIYQGLTAGQQDIMRRLLLRLVEVSEDGEATRRRVEREELNFQNVSRESVQEVIDRLTAPDSRLLIASREIPTSEETHHQPHTYIEVSHEAFIREWERFKGWIAEDLENLRYSTELLKAAYDWANANRDPAYLLTGNRLVRAEEWLENADANALQREFVRTSEELRERRELLEREQARRELDLQRTATRRLRAGVGLLVVALIAAVGLLLLAESFRQQAVSNEQKALDNAAIAEQNALEARSFALAANADRALADDNGELAVALVVEANRLIESPPPESRFTLASVGFAPNTRLIYEGQTGPINAAVYTPDGRALLSGSNDGTLILWHAATGEILREFTGHEGRVTAVAISPDGELALSGSSSGILVLWDVATGTQLATLPQDGAINAVQFSRDGQTMLSASTDGSLLLWQREANSASLLRELSVPGGPNVTDVAFSPADPGVAVTTALDNTITVWDVDEGKPAARIQTIAAPLSVAFSPDGRSFAVGFKTARTEEDTRGIVRIFALQAVQEAGLQTALSRDESNRLPGELALFSGHTGDVQAIAFSPDGRWIASGGADTLVNVWDTVTGQIAESFTSHTSGIRDLAFNPNSRRLASASADRTVRIFDVVSAAIVRDFYGHANRPVSVAYVPGQRMVLSASFDGTLRLWDIETGRTIQELIGHTNSVLDVDVSEDGRRALTGSSDNTVRLWQIATGESVALEGHNAAVRAVRFLPGDEAFVSAGQDGTLILWLRDGEAWQAARYFLGGGQQPAGDPIFTVAISPDGARLVSGGSDNVIRVWDISTGEQVGNFEAHASTVQALAFSPDGTQIISGGQNGDLILLDATSGAVERRFIGGHTRAIQAVSFSPDGGSVLSAAFDFTIRLWDIATGFELRRYELDESALVNVYDVVISPDAETVLSGHTDGTLRLWRLYPTLDALLTWTLQNRFVLELDCEQRRQFRLELCDADGVPPNRDPFPVPDRTPEPQPMVALGVGSEVIVNNTNDQRLRLRSSPTTVTNANIVAQLDDATRATIVDGPHLGDGLIWWRIRTEGGIEGWAVGFMDDSSELLQTLVPVEIFEGEI